MTEQFAVKVEQVGMRFNMSKERVDSLKERIVRTFKGTLFYEEFWALTDVSFHVRSGEMFGIVGFNGAGKSTVLKVIAGVLNPTTGTVETHGNIAPLIELGAGFDGELTAQENVFLNGAVLGYDESFMQSKYDEIIRFSELQEFQEVPVKNFSSGMYARLAFSVATMVQPDIIIADEILSVGDFRFQEKCLERIQDMKKNGTTILLVSHSMDMVKDNCDRAVLLEKGKVLRQGDAREVCEAYLQE